MTIDGVCRATTQPRKYSGEGKKTAVSFSVAYSFKGFNEDRKLEDFSEFYQVQVFGYVADLILESVSKGDKLYLSGKVIPTQFKGKNGDIRIQNTVNPDVICPTFDSKLRKGNSGGGYQNNNNGYQNNRSQGKYNDNEEEAGYDENLPDLQDYTDGYPGGEDLLSS